MDRMRGLVGLGMVLVACGDDGLPPVDAGAPDLPPTVDAGPPPPPSADLCDRVRPGPGTSDAVEVGLSRAHAAARFFRMDGSLLAADRALIAGLTEHGLSESLLDGYAAELDLCAANAAGTPREIAVTDLGWATSIRAGVVATSPEAPTGRVVLDLRDLTVEEATYLRASLEGAVGAFTPLRHGVRRRQGMASELGEVGAPDAYEAGGGNFDPEPWTGEGSASTLIVLTGPRMAPAAAELAITLRLANRAWLVGEDVETGVAEMHWEPVVGRGLLIRDTELVDRTTLERVPDRIPADVRALDALLAAETLAPDGPPPPRTGALPDERAGFLHPDPRAEHHDVSVDRPALQAAGLILHGSLRRFFPYFDVVPDRIDERLASQLAALDELDLDDRAAVVDWVRHLLQAVDDGHGFVGDRGAPYDPEQPSHLPLALEFIGDRLVVYASADAEVHPGDEVLAIAGRRVPELYAEYAEVVSAASEGYRRDLVTRRLVQRSVTTTVVVRAPGDPERSVELEPVVATVQSELMRALTGRASGPLDDLGHPDVHYINLDGSWVVQDETDVLGLLARAAESARGVVVDMRGYPGGLSYRDQQEAIGRITGGAALSGHLVTPVWLGAGREASVEVQQTWPAPTGPALEVPVMWLVGPHTVSQAEHVSQVVVGSGAVTVVGRPSAATNGNITGVELPGRIVATFTGMRVTNPDGSRFHGVGIVPDVTVEPTPEGVAAGRDEILEAALAALE